MFFDLAQTAELLLFYLSFLFKNILNPEYSIKSESRNLQIAGKYQLFRNSS